MSQRSQRQASKRTLQKSSPLLREEECALRKALYASLKIPKSTDGEAVEAASDVREGYNCGSSSWTLIQRKQLESHKLTERVDTEVNADSCLGKIDSSKTCGGGSGPRQKILKGRKAINNATESMTIKKKRKKRDPEPGKDGKRKKRVMSKRNAKAESSEEESEKSAPIKVDRILQAQRKFAHSQPCSPSSLLSRQVATLLPERPKTEDFIKYLCLRDTPHLPSRLSIFNNPCLPPSPLSSDDDVECEAQLNAQHSFSPIQTAVKTSSCSDHEKTDDKEWLTLTDSGMVYIPHRPSVTPKRTAKSPRKRSLTAEKKKIQMNRKSSSKKLSYDADGSKSSNEAMAQAHTVTVRDSETEKLDTPVGKSGKIPSHRGRKSASQLESNLSLNVYESELYSAPVLRPMESDFKSPAKYIVKTNVFLIKFGGGVIVPPDGWRPPSTIDDDIRFNTRLQHTHCFRHRSNPTSRNLKYLQACLETTSVQFDSENIPQIGGCEVDFGLLADAVQACGGLEKVNSIKKWLKVADHLKLPRSAQGKAAKLEDIYVKYILPYNSLPDEEKHVINARVDQMLDSSDAATLESPEIKGKSMSLVAFHKLSCNAQEMYGDGCESAADCENKFWDIVNFGRHHVAVVNGEIDVGQCGGSFRVSKSKSGWSLLSLPMVNGSGLRYLGSNHELTCPVLKFESIFTASGWSKTPLGCHIVDYLHTGADKIWYTIPSCTMNIFMASMKKLAPDLVSGSCPSDSERWIHSALVSPVDIIRGGCPVTRMIQKESQFVFLLPDVYYCCVSTGYSCAERVCFAPVTWLTDCVLKREHVLAKKSCFSVEKIWFNFAKEEVDRKRPMPMTGEVLDRLRSIQHKEQSLRRAVMDLGVCVREESLAASPGSKQRRTSSHVDWHQCRACGRTCYLAFVETGDPAHVLCLSDAADLKEQNRDVEMWIITQVQLDELDNIVAKLSDKLLHLQVKADDEAQDSN